LWWGYINELQSGPWGGGNPTLKKAMGEWEKR